MWNDYEAFERSHSEELASALLAEFTPKYQHARTVYLERARVAGIRGSETDPKVLMNNRVYRLNEVVDRDLQLRVIHIAPRELRFEDPSAHIYRKTF